MKTRKHPLIGMLLALASLVGAATMSLAQVASPTEECLPYPSECVAQHPEMPMPRLVEDQQEKCATESCTRNDGRVLILPPLRRGEPCSAGCEAPTECEVLRVLASAKDSKECACIEKSRDNIKVLREKVVDTVDAPRFFPLVGLAQLHHCSWKCTVLFSETMQIDYPFLMKIKTQRMEVVYIDKDHLHLCTAAETAWSSKSECALLPTDTVAFATIRVADMLDKFGISSQLDKLEGALFPGLKEKIFIPMTTIERCTLALFDMTGSEAVVLIHLTDKPADVKEFQKRLKKTFDAVQFIDDRTILIGSNAAALKRCGQTNGKVYKSEQDCARALEMAGQHDFFAWGRLSALPSLDSFMLPHGIESGMVMLDLGDQLTIQIHVACADEESSRWTKKALQTGLDWVRAELLTICTQCGEADLIPLLGNSEYRRLPLKTMRIVEKALQGAEPQHDGTEIHLAIALPVNTRIVRCEAANFMRLMRDDQIELPTFGEKLDLGAVAVVGAGAYTTPAPTSSDTAAVIVGGTFGVPQVGVICTNTNAAIPNNAPHALVGSNSTVTPAVVQATAQQPAKLSIANVRKDAALVFKMMGDGKMEFVQKIAPGEAIDVQTDMSQRWIAIFADKPAGESFAPTQAESVWLLRAPATQQPAPNPPDQGVLTPRPPAPVQPATYPPAAPLPPPPSYPVPMPYGLTPAPMPYGMAPAVPVMPSIPYTYPPQSFPAQPPTPYAPAPSNPLPPAPTVPQASR